MQSGLGGAEPEGVEPEGGDWAVHAGYEGGVRRRIKRAIARRLYRIMESAARQGTT